MSNKYRKYCIVPGCTNTSITTPNKRFLYVPSDSKRRSAWLKAVRTSNKYSEKSVLNVCEDHFNLEEDAENWLQIKLNACCKVMLKQSVVPHIFECQQGRRYAQPVKERPAAVNRARRSLLQTLASPLKTNIAPERSSPERDNPDDPQQCPSPSKDTDTDILPSPNESSEQQWPRHLTEERIITPRKRTAAEALCELFSDAHARHPPKKRRSVVCQQVAIDIPPQKTTVRSRWVQCNRSPMKIFKETATSPFKKLLPPKEVPKVPKVSKVQSTADQVNSNDEGTSLSADESSGSSYKPSGGASSGGEARKVLGAVDKDTNRELHLKKIHADPMYYLGVPLEYYYLIEHLAKSVLSDTLSVLICLQKIRLNQSFKGLAYDFGVSESFALKVFCKLVPDLGKCLKTLVLWPDKKTIKKRLPLYFSARYYNVQSIIDCFEIEIEKPTDPVNQTLTWSNYKKANTLKYFISCTPDGYINYISGGFGGRTSDAKITENCGYLNVLPDNCSVMADRGFKGIAPMLEKKNCPLVRPPSVSASEKCTKDQVKLSKRIASLRIHIERVIRRIREFSFLKPHSSINKYLCKYTDPVVQIACGLANLQAPLIKKYA